MSAIESKTITTSRLATYVSLAGSPDKPCVVLLHGNVSSGQFYDRIQAELASDFYVVVPDMRGFGKSETKAIDATRGVADLSDDIAALLDSPELGLARDAKVHVVGWSAGGNVTMQLALDHGDRVASMILINPGSPYGYGGSKDLAGTPCWPDCAGSGGGTANPQFVELLRAKDMGDSEQVSPRNVMNGFYWKPPFKPEGEAEDRYVAAMLDTAIGEGNYPGTSEASDNWPGMAPGATGMVNALSPKYLNQSGIVELASKPAILWVRGSDDQIVSDTSMFDIGFLGSLGAVPGWPGAEVYPPQPMVGQTRAVLERYAAAGGSFRELVFEDTGHGPHIEKHDEFIAAAREFWAS